MLKLKILGVNAVFGYVTSIRVGKSLVVATATCTALYVEALPPPPALHIAKTIRDVGAEHDLRLLNLQKDIERLAERNKCAVDVTGTLPCCSVSCFALLVLCITSL